MSGIVYSEAGSEILAVPGAGVQVYFIPSYC
jgi:hypothetical protein